MDADKIRNPRHYTMYPVQPKEITRYLGFNLGNAVKYVMRAPFKGGVEDCLKAIEYLNWERETPQNPISAIDYKLVEKAIEKLGDFLGLDGDQLWMDIAAAQSIFLINLDSYLLEYPDGKYLIDNMIIGIEGLRKALQWRDAGDMYSGMRGLPKLYKGGANGL